MNSYPTIRRPILPFAPARMHRNAVRPDLQPLVVNQDSRFYQCHKQYGLDQTALDSVPIGLRM
jgi:hypothetical protein